MKIKEALEIPGMNFYAGADTPIDDPNVVGKTKKMEKWTKLLTKGDPLPITYAVNAVPRIEVEAMIQKLLKPGYSKLKGTETAISKLKWRRGF